MAVDNSTPASNNVATAGALMVDNFDDLLNDAFEEVAVRKWSVQPQGLAHFKVVNTSKDRVLESAAAGVGLMQLNDDEDNIPLDTLIQGFDHTVTPKDFRLGIRITARLRETDQFGVINQLQSLLAQSPVDTTEYWTADVFNSGFDTNGQFLCADQLYLFDTARPYEDPSAGTWSNLETASALTSSSLSTMRLNFKANKNERGLLRPLQMQKIIVPPALEEKAHQLMKSTYTPEDALNSVNFHNGRFQIDTWDYLTSSTAWFGCSAMDDLYELKFWWRIRPGHVGNKLSDNPDIMQHRLRMSFVAGCKRPHSLRGNVGA